jgi:hypothetical protein
VSNSNFPTAVALLLARAGVPASPEFIRVRDLPLRDPIAKANAVVGAMTAELKLPGGTQELSPDQALCLHEAREIGGLVAILRPGEGKTHVGVLAATVLNAKRPLYLCPSAAREELVEDRLPTIRKHWRVHPHLQVVGFGELQTKEGRKIIKTAKPDVIIVDEMHKLKNKDSARGNRFVSIFSVFDELRKEGVNLPYPKLVLMTGSPSNRALVECSHLFAMALGEGSPIPLDPKDIATWSLALGSDVQEHQRPRAGAMKAFIDLLTPAERVGANSDVELLRRGFAKRLAWTPGVVKSSSAPLALPLIIRAPKVDVPEPVREAYGELLDTWSIGDEVYTEVFEAVRAMRQLVCGFYYRWVWPEQKKNQLWIDRRKDWHKQVKGIIQNRPKRRQVLANEWVKNDPRWDEPLGLDSKGLIEDACKAHEAYTRARAVGHPLAAKLEHVPRIDSPWYRDWRAVRHEYDPVTEAVWLDEYLVDYAISWARETGGLVWVPHSTVGERIDSKGLPYFAGGKEADRMLRAHKGPCAASFKSHHESKDLQRQWNRVLYLLPPATGQQWEQSLARVHRRGSPFPDVQVDVLLLSLGTLNSWDQALRDAKYAHEVFDVQRLCQADLEGTRFQIADRRVKHGDHMWREAA